MAVSSTSASNARDDAEASASSSATATAGTGDAHTCQRALILNGAARFSASSAAQGAVWGRLQGKSGARRPHLLIKDHMRRQHDEQRPHTSWVPHAALKKEVNDRREPSRYVTVNYRGSL